MKKQPLYVLALLAILQTTQVRAQTQTQLPEAQTQPAAAARQPAFHRWSVSLQAGPSLPVGKFASGNPTSDEAGHAHVGVGAELALTRWFNRRVGLTFAAAGQQNAIGAVTPPPNPVTGTVFTRNDPWKVGRLLAGATLDLPLSSPRLSLVVRALAGVIKTTSPANTLRLYVSGNPLDVKIAAVPFSWAFAYEAGASLKWQSPGRLFLLADAAYGGAKPNFYKEYPIMVDPVTRSVITVQHKQPIGAMQISAGAGISF
ncbi:hypothetical protein [Puia sp.]|uniref:hypothetical protein n=1 Tax=Puia sp. TaxID=2045100 RepID=UPI002F3ECE0C